MSALATASNYPALTCAVLLTISNVFMTFAWYGHLKHLQGQPWWIAALVAWFVALFEYMFQVPANRVGYTALTLPQLKIMQEVITLTVFVPLRSCTWDSRSSSTSCGPGFVLWARSTSSSAVERD